MLRSPTFFVGAERQKKNMEDFHRKEQCLAEAYHKNKPLCFQSQAYQQTHPTKAQKGHKDADATLTAPMILGVADGVSQIEDFGIDASLLPRELLKVCDELAMYQLIPGTQVEPQDTYRGPIPLMRRAFEATESLGSLTVCLAIMDNSTKIHGKLHPMVAIITIGDCELLILRRVQGARTQLQAVCHTEMQRIDGHAQTPLQLARVDARIDPDFYEGITIEVIEKGSAVHCVSAYEGDIVIMGSDGVFDNLFLDEITDLANTILSPSSQTPVPDSQLKHLATSIVKACHDKTRAGPNGVMPEAPIGKGGKKDDTSCVVGEVIEWTEAHSKIWKPRRRPFEWQNALGSALGTFFAFDNCCAATYESDDDLESRGSNHEPAPGVPSRPRAVPASPAVPLTVEPLGWAAAGNAAGVSSGTAAAGSSPQVWNPASPAPAVSRVAQQWSPNTAQQPWAMQPPAYGQPARPAPNAGYGLPTGHPPATQPRMPAVRG